MAENALGGATGPPAQPLPFFAGFKPERTLLLHEAIRERRRFAVFFNVCQSVDQFHLISDVSDIDISDSLFQDQS
ncbi:hypothetical protein [Brucella intermedia]|uniref:hypothetical protein n=1 Tax=Brucella intermedia TaxID=94625 RepID=UPI00224990B5|nr:hypothetical protein [Brucella intermedia]